MSAVSQLDIGSARRIDIELPGQRIAALQAGPPDGRSALLIPGYTGSKEDFGPVLDALAGAGFLVTAIDLPGQLDSPAPAAVGGYLPARLADCVRALAARGAGRSLLLGHSFGGLVARAAVIAEPALFESLVLLCSGPSGLGGRRRALMDELDPVLASSGLPALYAAMRAAWRRDPRYVEPPAEVAEFLERRFLCGSAAMLQGMGDALRHEPDRVAELAAVGLPILVAHGADDDAWPPPVQREMAERLAAEYVVIPDSAHSPAVENAPETVRALLNFWGGVLTLSHPAMSARAKSPR